MTATIPNESATSRFLRVARGELIGRPVEIVESADATLADTRGTVVDETLNTFVVECEDNGRTIRVPKLNNTFAFPDEDGTVVRVPGERIHYRPEDRIKRVR